MTACETAPTQFCKGGRPARPGAVLA